MDFKNDGSYWYTGLNSSSSSNNMVYRRRNPYYRRWRKKRSFRRRFKRRYRRRPVKRRRRAWGRRVRRAALRAHESKRYEINESIQTLTDTNPVVEDLVDIDLWEPSTDDALSDKKTHREGKNVYLTGAKLRFWFKNTTTTNHYVRIIVYSNRQDTDEANQIFKDKTTEAFGSLTSAFTSGQTWEAINAQINRSRITVYKDVRCVLNGTDTAEMGTADKHVQMWIPFKNKTIKWESAVTNTDHNPRIYCMFYVCPKDLVVPVGNQITYAYDHTIYFKDP